MLDEALAATPAGPRGDVAEARAAAQVAREELARTASGDAGRMLAHRGLAAALLDLASSAGADADIRIGCDIEPGGCRRGVVRGVRGSRECAEARGAARIWLRAVAEAGELRVEVADDGVGGADTGYVGCASACPGRALTCTYSACRLAVPVSWPSSRLEVSQQVSVSSVRLRVRRLSEPAR
jgi:hypothetical protein